MGGILRQYGPMVYLPSLVFSLGEGAMVPLIPVIATQRGADIPTAALVASAIVVGTLFGNLPAGWLVGRIGERLTMAIAGAVALLGAVGCAVLPGLVWFAAAVFVIGMAAAALLDRLMPAWTISLPSLGACVAVLVVTVLVVQIAATWPVRLTRRIPPHLVSRSPSVRL